MLASWAVEKEVVEGVGGMSAVWEGARGWFSGSIVFGGGSLGVEVVEPQLRCEVGV